MPSACFKRRRWWRLSGKILGDWNKKHKKQPFGDASASHLSLVLWHVWFQAGAWISHTTSPTPPSYEVGAIAKRIKTTRLRRKKPVGTWYFTSAHNFNTILNISHLARTRSIASLPCKIVFCEIWYDLLPVIHFIIRGFSPWNGERFLSLGQRG